MEENESNYTQEEKDKMIKKEVLKLRRIYKDLDKEKFDTVFSLIEEAAFMVVTLKDLKQTINRVGSISKYQNGENQWGTKKSPEVEIYNTMIKNHMAIIKQLSDLLPKQVGTPGVGDDLDKFVGSK